MDLDLTLILPYLTSNRSFKVNSVRLIMGRLKIFQSYLRENNLTLSNETIMNFLMEKKKETGNNNTVNSYICAINKLIDYFCYHDLYREKELRTVKSLKKTRPPIDVLSPSEMKALWQTDILHGHYRGVVCDWRNEVDKTAIMFLALTGCRYSEMAALRKCDLDLANQEATFRTSKNGEWRRVGIQEPLLSALYRLIKDKKNEDIIFCTYTGRGIHATDFSKTLKKRAEICGISKKVHPHIFRHSFVTEMHRRRVGISTIARIVGHKDIKSTDYYASIDITEQKNSMLHHKCMQEGADPVFLIKRGIEALEEFDYSSDKRFFYEKRELDNGRDVYIHIKVKQKSKQALLGGQIPGS